jgi:hypothetical protein
MAICYILWSFGIFLPVLVFCTKKNLATLSTMPISTPDPTSALAKIKDLKILLDTVFKATKKIHINSLMYVHTYMHSYTSISVYEDLKLYTS